MRHVLDAVVMYGTLAASAVIFLVLVAMFLYGMVMTTCLLARAVSSMFWRIR